MGRFNWLKWGIVGAILLTGCGEKQMANYSPLQLHTEIKKGIRNGNLDTADDAFLEMEGQYPDSPYVPIDAVALALAHAQNGEYRLADQYLNIYENRFADQRGVEWAEYQKVKFLFKSYVNPYTDEELLKRILNRAESYLSRFPDSPYRPEVETIWVKTKLTLLYLNRQIDSLYQKLGDRNATRYYRDQIPANSQPPQLPFYKRLFYW